MRQLPLEDSFHDIINELLIVINFEYTNLINEKKNRTIYIRICFTVTFHRVNKPIKLWAGATVI